VALAAEDLSVPALRSAGVEASPALFLAALESCSRWQVPRRPPHTRRTGRAPGTRTPAHVRTPQAALRLLEGMRACELEPSTRAYNVAMRACVKGGNWAAALDTFDKLPEPDVVRSRRRTPSPHSTAAPGASRSPTPALPRPRRSPTAPRSTRARAGGGGRRPSRCSAGCATGARGRSRTRSC